ncbi:Asr2958 protein [hydrothermal vent metagenome]|uniref:Asr2958 protein n=1 Tax=hydrothermal vent metagenome TaxID=652676 RepID=A0A1W1CLI7_9ZZZZ
MKPEKLSYFNGNITIDSDVCNGKPTIRGQRITVQTILEFLSAGESTEKILRAYPTLIKEDIQTCLAFATQLRVGCFPPKTPSKPKQKNKFVIIII